MDFTDDHQRRELRQTVWLVQVGAQFGNQRRRWAVAFGFQRHRVKPVVETTPRRFAHLDVILPVGGRSPRLNARLNILRVVVAEIIIVVERQLIAVFIVQRQRKIKPGDRLWHINRVDFAFQPAEKQPIFIARWTHRMLLRNINLDPPRLSLRIIRLKTIVACAANAVTHVVWRGGNCTWWSGCGWCCGRCWGCCWRWNNSNLNIRCVKCVIGIVNWFCSSSYSK